MERTYISMSVVSSEAYLLLVRRLTEVLADDWNNTPSAIIKQSIARAITDTLEIAI